MRKQLALTPLFLIATALPAQSGFATIEGMMPQSSPTNVVAHSAPTSNNCPIGVTAQHTSGATIEQVTPSTQHHPLSFDITLNAIDGRLIRQAKITLHGIAGGHVLPATTKDTTNLTESFTLTPNHQSRPTFHSVVYTNNLTGVDWIAVNEVTYTDGTQWHQTAGSLCRVAPNGLLPVTTTAH